MSYVSGGASKLASLPRSSGEVIKVEDILHFADSIDTSPKGTDSTNAIWSQPVEQAIEKSRYTVALYFPYSVFIYSKSNGTATQTTETCPKFLGFILIITNPNATNPQTMIKGMKTEVAN